MRILFTVRRNYYDMIVAGTKTEEIRRASKRWLTLASRCGVDKQDVAVFMCGRLLHRRRIKEVSVVKEGATKVLGRPLSEQGMKDVGPGPVVVFYLAETV